MLKCFKSCRKANDRGAFNTAIARVQSRSLSGTSSFMCLCALFLFHLSCSYPLIVTQTILPILEMPQPIQTTVDRVDKPSAYYLNRVGPL